MLPILYNINGFSIYTAGVFFFLAFLWASYFLWKNIKITSFKEDDAFDGLFTGLFGGLIFSRLVYVSIDYQNFNWKLDKIILINGYPGMSIYGFFIGFFIFLAIFSAIKKINFADFVDYYAPPFMLAIAIGKLGSFFSGAEIGAKVIFPLSIKYQYLDGTRHLTSFYESICFFIGTFIIYKLLSIIRRGKLSKGFSFQFLFWFISLVYVIFDTIRTEHVFLLNYDVYFVFSSFLLLTFSIYFMYYFRKEIFSFVIGLFIKK